MRKSSRWSDAIEEATQVADLQKLCGEMAEKLNLYEKVKTLPPHEIPVYHTGGGGATAIAMLSDTHFEERVDPKDVPGAYNLYNPAVATKRAEQFAQRVVLLTQSQRNLTAIDDIVLAILGDLITGFLHEDNVASNWMPPLEAILFALKLVNGIIKHLLDHGEFDRIIIPCVFGNHGRCHDASTELLTEDGWRTYETLRVGDLVATYNMETGANEWQPLQDVYVAPYSGGMVHVKTATTDFMVTPHHRMVLHQKRSGKNSVVEMENITADNLGSSAFPRTAEGHNVDYAEVTDDELSLLGWLWTDGSIHFTPPPDGSRGGVGSYNYSLYQSKPEGIAQIQSLLERMGYAHTVYKRERTPPVICGTQCKTAREENHFYIATAHVPRLRELMTSKKGLPDWFRMLSRRQVGVFLDAVKAGDGAAGKKPDGFFEIHGKAPELSALQALLVTNGRAARLRTSNRGDAVLSVRETNLSYINDWDSSVTTVPYTGVIWCGTVANGTLITRRNGMTLVSGNTTRKPAAKMAATTNLEWMLYHLLARDWANEPRVQFHIAEGLILYLQVGKFTLRCLHGDRIDYKGGILGLSTPVIKAAMKMNQTKFADLTLMGHYHSAYDFGNVIVNGSMIGYNAYSVALNIPYERPRQQYILLDQKRGKSLVADIWCDYLPERKTP